MANKSYKNKDIEEETVSIVRRLFSGNPAIDTFLSDNDKTPITDGFIKYKGLDFAVQIKGSKTDSNTKIKTKYLSHVNHQTLIYFYCSNVFEKHKAYYKIFTKKEFEKSSLYDNYQNYRYSISFTKKARYILFKPFDLEIFTSELDSIYKDNLPTKTIQDIGELFGNIEPNGKEVKFDLSVEPSSNFGEYKINKASSVVDENDKIINKIVDGNNVGIALGNNIGRRGILQSIIDMGEQEIDINGRKVIVKFKVDPISKKGALAIGEHRFIMNSESIQEDEQNVNITGTADYNILYEDIESLENFILFFSQFPLAQEIKEKLTKDLETSKSFNAWLTSNQLDKTITSNIDNRLVLYNTFTTPITIKYRIADLGNNKYLLFIINNNIGKYMSINTVGKLTFTMGNIKIEDNYFLLIIHEYMHKGMALDYLFNMQNIDFRQEIPKYMQLLQPHQDLLGILVVIAIHYYVYSKDEVIYDLLERSFLNNINEESCFINYMQLKKHKGLKLTLGEEERLNELSNSKINGIPLTVNIILGNNGLVKKLYNQLSNEVQEAFRYSPVFELFDKSILE